MRFDLQPNVMCLLYEHPLLLERPRGWTPKDHHPVVESLQHPQPDNGGVKTAVESAMRDIKLKAMESTNEPVKMPPLWS